MSAPLKVLLVSLLLLLWLLFSHWIYSPCYQCNQIENRAPLLFEWNKAAGITNAQFADLKTKLTSQCADGEVLEITGYYFTEEKNDSEFANLGLARAAALKTLLAPELAAEQIVLNGRAANMPADANKNPQKQLFEGAEFICKKSIPLYSNWTNGTALKGAGFAAYYADILAKRQAGEQLEIIGLYYAEEENNTDFENLGLARANAVKELFLADVPSDQIVLTSREIGETDEVRTNDFLSAAISWRKGSRTLERLDDRVVIRFPFNSVKKDFDPVVDEYLAQLAEQLKTSGQKVELTGHTDNVGGAEANEKLALRRAKMIRDVLRKKGVNRNQIITLSQGENAPVASNNTEEGRHENRRTEVKILD
ncbi:MAG: OmpA family protein [Saprospiraceae bacterium]